MFSWWLVWACSHHCRPPCHIFNFSIIWVVVVVVMWWWRWWPGKWWKKVNYGVPGVSSKNKNRSDLSRLSSASHCFFKLTTSVQQYFLVFISATFCLCFLMFIYIYSTHNNNLKIQGCWRLCFPTTLCNEISLCSSCFCRIHTFVIHSLMKLWNW